MLELFRRFRELRTSYESAKIRAESLAAENERLRARITEISEENRELHRECHNSERAIADHYAFMAHNKTIFGATPEPHAAREEPEMDSDSHISRRTLVEEERRKFQERIAELSRGKESLPDDEAFFQVGSLEKAMQQAGGNPPANGDG